jgi:hypothetical protein
VPGPLPDAVVNLTQVSALLAVHAHPAPAETVMPPADAPAVTDALVGATPYPHPPACVIVTVCPATVSMPDRCAVAVFCATEYCTEPVPVPPAGAVTVIHGAELDANQVQPATDVTDTIPVDAAAPAAAVVGLTP